MRKQNYIAPAIENIAVEFENGIAQSSITIPEGYGTAGAAGAGADETGTTTW
jgi:hypothetical protein